MKIFVTGGAGFIGSAVVRQLIRETDATVVNVDKLTYAASLDSVAEAALSPRYCLEKIDICDVGALTRLFSEHRPDAVLHLAAESHVDRSIDGPDPFIATNIVGTFNLLEAARSYWSALSADERARFRFHHVSTDEVYGSLGKHGAFTEETPYRPTSPYSASKAAADHLARAWHHTFDLPTIVTNSSNNFGPYQFPEKLIPTVILKALAGRPIPVYGQGQNIRDWIYVDDHAVALRLVLEKGRVGETYNIGSRSERSNIEVVRGICGLLDELLPNSPHRPHDRLVTFVTDRPGHDLRYAMDADKLERDLGWTPHETFDAALRKTVEWYLANSRWCEQVMAGGYGGERQGLQAADGRETSQMLGRDAKTGGGGS